MPDQPFVINDRRKFTSEGDLRPDAAPSEPKPVRDDSPIESSASLATEAAAGPRLVHSEHTSSGGPSSTSSSIAGQGGVPSDLDADSQTTEDEANQPPPLTAEQSQQANSAYSATVDRLDTAIRASNPAMGPIPEMNFERLVQSIYMQTLLQLGLAGEPNSTPQVDLLGARSSIDMLGIIEQKTKGNLTESETKLIEAALFEMRMGFLEITQALARQAANRQPPPGTPPGPSIVR
jgi:hypothetical protein